MAKHLRSLVVGVALAALLAAGMVALGAAVPTAHAQSEVVGRYTYVQMPSKYKEAQPQAAFSGQLLADKTVTGSGYMLDTWGDVTTRYTFSSGTWSEKEGKIIVRLYVVDSSGTPYLYPVAFSAYPGKPTVDRVYNTVTFIQIEVSGEGG